MVPRTRYSSASILRLGTAMSGLTCRPTMVSAGSCSALTSGQLSTEASTGKHSLKAGRGRGLRPPVTDAIAWTAPEMATCSGTGAESAEVPVSREVSHW